MLRIFAIMALVGAGGWMIFGPSIRRRYDLRMKNPRAISMAMLAVECLLFGFLLARTPLFRSPVGLAIAFPLFLGLHAWGTARLAKYFRGKGLLRASPIRSPEAQSKLHALAARHFYISITLAYVLVVGLLVVVRYWVKG